MKTLMMTHTDLDGISAIIIAQLLSLDITEYRFLDYKNLYQEDSEKFIYEIGGKYDRILVVDISVNSDFYDQIQSHGKRFGVFDHHNKTVDIESFEHVYADIEKSGTEIFYNAISKDKRLPSVWREYVRIVSAYDLWKLDSPYRETAENLNRVYYQTLNYRYKDYDFRKYEAFIDIQVEKLLSKKGTFYFTEFEQWAIEKAREKESRELDSALSNMKQRIDDAGISYIIYHGSSKVSYVCNELLKIYPDAQYVINVNTYSGSVKKKTNGKLSIRSQDNFDVTTLKGINGHKNAGGGQFSLAFVKKLWYTDTVHLGYEES